MYEIKETGGARIGFTHCSKPFAILTVNKNKLELNASVIGNLIFRPTDITAILPTSSPFGGGITITHTVPNYPKNVVFTSLDNLGLIEKIKQSGFLDNKSPIPADIDFEIVSFQQTGRFPIKTSAAIILVLLWNVLILSNFYTFFTGDKKGSPVDWGLFSALGIFIITTVLIFISEPFRNIVLKPGRKIEHVNRFLYFIILICSILMIGFSFVSSISQH